MPGRGVLGTAPTLLAEPGREPAQQLSATLSERGTFEPSRKTVIFWGAATGAVASVMLLGGADALSGLQNVTIVASLPFLLIMVGLWAALVRDLLHDPQVVRRQYDVAAVEYAVVAGVTEHGDDFAITVRETAAGEGVGELVPTEPVMVEEGASAKSSTERPHDPAAEPEPEPEPEPALSGR